MSSTSFAGTREWSLRPSSRAIGGLLVLHASAILLTFAASPPVWVGLVLALGFVVSWTRLRRHRAFGYGPQAVVRLRVDGENHWHLTLCNGTEMEAALLGSSVIWPRLLALGWRAEDGRRHDRVLLGDEMDAEGLRQLRARLLNPVATSAPG